MKLNPEELEEMIEPVEKTDLIYGIDDRPPFKEALFAALQHLLAIFVAIITPPLIIAGALKLDLETTGFLVSMALFASGISTFIQCRRIGPVGAKLLCIQGTSFSFIGPIITAGLAGGLPLIFGACIAAAPIEMVISRTFKYMRSIITPLVSGIVVLLIGLSLIKVGIVSCGGGYGAMDNGTFGSIRNIGVAATVLLSVLFFNRCKNKYLRMSSIVLGLCIGYALAYFLGMVDMAAASSQSLMGFNIPMPFKYGLDLNFSAFVAIGLVYLITAIEATGDVTANSMISGKSIEGEGYLKRVSGGVLADGVNSFIAGIFNSFPNSIFAQNNGIIQLTGVASRYVGIVGTVPGCWRCLFLDAGPGVGWGDLIDVRYGCGCRHTDYRFAGNQPEGYFGLGGQPLARLGGGTDAGYPEYGTGSYKGHFFFRDHDRGACRYFCECIDTSQRR